MKISTKSFIGLCVTFCLISSFNCQVQPTTTITTTTTVAPPAPPLDILNFTIPKNESAPTCLKLVTSIQMKINYKSKSNPNASILFNVTGASLLSYDGECEETLNTLTFLFGTAKPWMLAFNYTLNKMEYSLTGMRLDYVIEAATFPDADPSVIGQHRAELSNLTESTTSKGNSYKCTALTQIQLNSDVTVDLSNYQAEAFMDETKKGKDFDIATSCPADITGQSKIVPIIVGSCLAALVVLVLIAYIIGRRKHRPGYQQV